MNPVWPSINNGFTPRMLRFTARAYRVEDLSYAAQFVRDAWVKQGGFDAMNESFRAAPSVQDSIAEGQSLESAVADHMASAFGTAAWNAGARDEEAVAKFAEAVRDYISFQVNKTTGAAQ